MTVTFKAGRDNLTPGSVMLDTKNYLVVQSQHISLYTAEMALPKLGEIWSAPMADDSLVVSIG